MNRIYLLSLLTIWIVLFNACKESQHVTVNEESFAAIMADIAIKNQLLRKVGTAHKDSIDSIYTEQIEQIHNISLDSFSQHLEVIQQNPDAYKLLLDQSFELLKEKEKNLKGSKTR